MLPTLTLLSILTKHLHAMNKKIEELMKQECFTKTKLWKIKKDHIFCRQVCFAIKKCEDSGGKKACLVEQRHLRKGKDLIAYTALV